jgi:high-affinity nickel-transport protein
MNAMSRIKKLYYSASPDLRRRLIIMFGSLLAFNIMIWVVALYSAHRYPLLIGLVTLAYGFGLRHAVDADHIAAIDNTTRKLMREGKRPVAVGLFFSIGHSLVVIVLSLFVGFSASFVSQHLSSLKITGALIGTLISCLFLLLIGLINLSALIGTFTLWKKISRGEASLDEASLDEHLDNQGFLARILRPLLKIVTDSWNMLYIGFLFGLGFDTASEIGLLSLSAISAGSGLPLWNILLLPFAFAAGMTLIDSLNGVLMLAAYGWAYLKPVRKLYYNMTITLISVITALFIGTVEGLQLISTQLNINYGVFKLADNIDLGSFGYIIIGVFAISWGISMVVYRVRRYDLLDLSK